jgi:hypothetical protein
MADGHMAFEVGSGVVCIRGRSTPTGRNRTRLLCDHRSDSIRSRLP